jgi:hypothetical protein
LTICAAEKNLWKAQGDRPFFTSEYYAQSAVGEGDRRANEQICRDKTQVALLQMFNK